MFMGTNTKKRSDDIVRAFFQLSRRIKIWSSLGRLSKGSWETFFFNFRLSSWDDLGSTLSLNYNVKIHLMDDYP